MLINKLKNPVLITCLLLVACHHEKPGSAFETMNEGELTNKHFFFSVPYQYSSDSAAVIEVRINGKIRRFMVDTGAPLSISRSLQKEMSYPGIINTTTRDSNGDTTGVEIVRVSSLFIDTLEFRNIPALVLDLEQAVFSCDKYDGLIGSNLLRLLVIQFNKPEQKIYFGDRIDPFQLPATTTSAKMSLNLVQSDPVISLTLNDEIIDSSLFDSGDKVLYTISKKRFDNINTHGDFNDKIAAAGSGVGGQGIVAKNTDSLPAFVLYFDSIAVAGKSIRNIYTEPNYSNPSRIGRGLWNYGVVTMDYPQKQFYFTPAKNDLHAESPSHFGIKYQDRNDKLVITVVWNNTGAYTSGLKPGFEIIQFGNFIPASVSKCTWTAFCKKEAEASNLIIKYVNEKGEIKQCSLQKTEFNTTK